MDYTAFFLAVFEVADNWTESVDPDSYAIFLELLLGRISEEGQLIEDLDRISCKPALGVSSPIVVPVLSAKQMDAQHVVLSWNPKYAGGAATTKAKDNYEFKAEGRVAVKSRKRGTHHN
jgi:hypothetical protein